MILIRVSTSDQGTFGYLWAKGRLFRSLELPWRDNARNISSIPAGEYPVKYVKTRRPRSGRWFSYWLDKVPGRSGILIHSGNWAGDRAKGLRTDSWGCILVGREVGVLSGQKALLASTPAVHGLHAALQGSETTLRVI